MKWLGYALGGALVAYGLSGLVLEVGLLGWALWFGGLLILHDAILAPAVLLMGTVLNRWRTALIVAGSLTLATLPTVLALGRRTDNPSILPLDYGLNLAIVLAAIVLLALARKVVR